MSADEARARLAARIQMVCDRLGNKQGGPAWSLYDVEAVRVLLKEERP